LFGTVQLSNTNTAGLAPEPFQLGLHSAPNYFYPHASGTNTLAYVDLTKAAQTAALAKYGSASLNPGQSVVLTSAVEVYSLTRAAPSDSQFDWVPPLTPTATK
jgi:hypothetical protein